MIVTLTLNPAVDKAVLVPNLELGTVHRVVNSEFDPAGKGINVSRVADRLGWPTIAFGFLAGDIGELVASALQQEGVQSHFVRVPGETRFNVTIYDETTSMATTFNERGPVVDGERLRELEAQVLPWLRVCRVLVLAGSLPPGVPDDVYARYIRLARSVGVQTILDADGEPLRLGVKAAPSLIKPNRAEAERLVGRPLLDMAAVREAGREIVAQGVETCVISLGAEGAVCTHGERAWLAVPPRIGPRSAVGTGDSMVAGLAVSMVQGQDVVEGLRLGTAAGAAAAMTTGTALALPTEIARLLPEVRVRELI
jgi:1-phosphofructokinase family hexose kinase